MINSEWHKKYLQIIDEFGYNEEKDEESAIILNSMLKKSKICKEITNLIEGNIVFVIGSGPSLSTAIPKLKNFKKFVKIAADSSVKALIENGIIPDIVITDLDGDTNSLKKIGKTDCIFVVHAHGDNIENLSFVKNFKRWIGTTQSKPFKEIQNFGGFTDGDRGVFLASVHHAKKIVLFGMDFGSRIGKFSETKRSEREIKLRKLRWGRLLLEWLSKSTKSELFTTSTQITGFKKITYKELSIIIT